MECVEAKNKLETYLYNTRNSISDDSKVRETLGADTVNEIETWVKEGIAWLEEHSNETKDVYVDKQKEYEDKIRPVMMKLYQNSGMSENGPTVEEVD